MVWTTKKEFGPVVVQGKQLRCTVCSHGDFWAHQIQLATPLFNLLDLDEWNRVADCAVCARCGYVHMFIPPHTIAENEPDQSDGMTDPARP